jgi:predicted dehydrogenase
MDKIAYGVIGVGALGRHHARWASQIEAFNLRGVYDLIGERASAVANETHCRAFASVDELIDACEAVSVAVSTTDHCEVALRVIDAGKCLLIEKPIAASLEEADRIISAARDKGVTLTVGHIERFNPALEALAGYDIRPKFIEAHRLSAFNPRGADVAVVLDLMIHDIDLALHLIKSPVADIAASAVAVVSDTVDIANARLTFDNGAVANLTASRISLRPMRKLRIFQSSGYFSLDLAEKQADLYRLLGTEPHDGEIAIPLGESGRNIGYLKRGESSHDMLQAELTAFAEAIRGVRPVSVTGEEAREALAVALAVIEKSRMASEATSIDDRQ